MSDPNISPNFIQWLLGVASLLFFTMLGWVNSKANNAATKADKSAATISACRQEIDNNMHELNKTLMTEVQVKDFVDRSIKPIEYQIGAINRKITDSHKEIMSELRK